MTPIVPPLTFGSDETPLEVGISAEVDIDAEEVGIAVGVAFAAALGDARPLTDTELRTIAVPVSGPLTDTELRTTAVPVSGPLTDTELRTTPVPVSGPLTDTELRTTAVPVSGPLTDTELRTTAVPVSGPLTDTELRTTPVPVSGPLTDTELRTTPVPVSGPATDAQMRASALPMAIKSITAGALQKSYTVAEDVTCTNANQDYVMGTEMAAGTKYLVVYSSVACKVAMGANTTSTNGVWVGAGVPTMFPVIVTGTVADDKAHVQSPTAGAVVTFTSMRD